MRQQNRWLNFLSVSRRALNNCRLLFSDLLLSWRHFLHQSWCSLPSSFHSQLNSKGTARSALFRNDKTQIEDSNMTAKQVGGIWLTGWTAKFRYRWQQQVSSVFLLVIAAATVLLGGRAAYLQLWQASAWQQQAMANRELRSVMRAPRGEIIDRQGREVASNQLQYTQLYIENDQLKERILTAPEAMDLQATSPADLRVNYKRVYPYGPVLAHTIGYVQSPLTGDDVVFGRTGLERVYNEHLAGQDGLEVFERNALGQATRLLAQQEPQKGQDLQLSIDAEMAAKAFEALGDQRGAVIISEPKTGKIWAIVSKPSYYPYAQENPDRSVAGSSFDDRWQMEVERGMVAPSLAAALDFPHNPFLFRPLAAAYPPGSVFKIVTALAGLEYEAIDSNTTVVDEGVLEVGDYSYANWYWTQYGRVEGELGVVRALARSNDIFFYKAAEWIGSQRLADFARLMGLGAPTGIDLPGEQSGLVPDPAWKQQHFGEQWYLGNTYHMGIGQGDVLVTPLQLHTLLSSVSADGRLCQPQVVLEQAPVCQELSLQPESLQLVKDGLRQACQNGGTAYPFFDSPYEVMCKTGTAEFGAVDEQGYRPTHGWFTVALTKQARDDQLPADQLKAELVVTVLVESDDKQKFKEGSADAAPIAREIADWWWSQ